MTFELLLIAQMIRRPAQALARRWIVAVCSRPHAAAFTVPAARSHDAL